MTSVRRSLDGAMIRTVSGNLRGWTPIVALLVLLAACLGLGSCAPGSDLPPLADPGTAPYTLGVGEKVRLITFGSEQLSGEFQVNDAGNIAVPLVGTISAAGKTSTELEQSIAKELLQKDLVKSPNVSVEITTYRQIFILGEVNKPGGYPYEPGMTVLSAVSIAGGFTYRAETDFASVVRTTGGSAAEGKVSRQSFVRPGDVITVFERLF